MGRQTYEAQGVGRVNRATGEAARIFSTDLAACSQMLRAMLDAAAAEDDWDVKMELLQSAVGLAGATVKLGEVLCKLKGETRQHISVERCDPALANAPQSVPKKRASRTRTTSISAENSSFARQNEGEGG
jgi:hypothetical protein